MYAWSQSFNSWFYFWMRGERVAPAFHGFSILSGRSVTKGRDRTTNTGAGVESTADWCSVLCLWVIQFVGLLWIVFSFSSVELSFGLWSGVEFRPDFGSVILYRMAECGLGFSWVFCSLWQLRGLLQTHKFVFQSHIPPQFLVDMIFKKKTKNRAK